MRLSRLFRTKSRWILIGASLILLVGFGSGCSDAPSTSEPARNATPRELSRSRNGTEMVSPVSGKNIVKASTTPSLVWDGKLYMFCCDTDRKKFQTNPNAYSKDVLPPNALLLDQ